ncbi:MAG: restriction endonuclease subunit S [Firmicutes bacterium]|nr:restriction endonuclease subunit S [Bacillota bacterium]
MVKGLVSNYAEQIRGVSYKPNDLHNGLDNDSVILLRANNIDDGRINFEDVVYVDRKKVSDFQYLRKGDVLICASSGSKNLVGKAASVDFDIECTFGAFCKVVRPTKVAPEFLGLFFQSPNYRKKISELAQGANINNIKNEHIDNLQLEIYSESEQRLIVECLSRTIAVINARKEELSKLDELIKARFVEMFGDVIHNTKGWEIQTFSDVTESRLGKMLDAKKQTGKYPFPYLANYNVQWFHFNLDDLNQMDFDEADQKEFELIDGDLMVCEGGEIGRCAVWHNDIQPCYFQKAIHRVRCKQEYLRPDYLAWWFKFNCDHGGFAAIEGAKATISHLPGAKLKKLSVTIPPLTLQNEFVTFVKQVDKSKVAIQKSLDETQLLFDSLMQEYFG